MNAFLETFRVLQISFCIEIMLAALVYLLPMKAISLVVGTVCPSTAGAFRFTRHPVAVGNAAAVCPRIHIYFCFLPNGLFDRAVPHLRSG